MTVSRSGTPTTCPDCRCAAGAPHEDGCAVERCVLCGGQAITCDCVYRLSALDPTDAAVMTTDPTDAMAAKYAEAVALAGGPLLWTGERPGVAECAEFGWYVVRRFGSRGTLPCSANERGAEPDLNRYARACAGGETGFRWDPTARRVVRVQ